MTMIVSRMNDSSSKSIHSVVLGGGVVATPLFYTNKEEVKTMSITVEVRNGNLEKAMRVLKKKASERRHF